MEVFTLTRQLTEQKYVWLTMRVEVVLLGRNRRMYRVSHLVADLGWVDLDLAGGLLYCTG